MIDIQTEAIISKKKLTKNLLSSNKNGSNNKYFLYLEANCS